MTSLLFLPSDLCDFSIILVVWFMSLMCVKYISITVFGIFSLWSLWKWHVENRHVAIVLAVCYTSSSPITRLEFDWETKVG